MEIVPEVGEPLFEDFMDWFRGMFIKEHPNRKHLSQNNKTWKCQHITFSYNTKKKNYNTFIIVEYLIKLTEQDKASGNGTAVQEAEGTQVEVPGGYLTRQLAGVGVTAKQLVLEEQLSYR